MATQAAKLIQLQDDAAAVLDAQLRVIIRCCALTRCECEDVGRHVLDIVIRGGGLHKCKFVAGTALQSNRFDLGLAVFVRGDRLLRRRSFDGVGDFFRRLRGLKGTVEVECGAAKGFIPLAHLQDGGLGFEQAVCHSDGDIGVFIRGCEGVGAVPIIGHEHIFAVRCLCGDRFELVARGLGLGERVCRALFEAVKGDAFPILDRNGLRFVAIRTCECQLKLRSRGIVWQRTDIDLLLDCDRDEFFVLEFDGDRRFIRPHIGDDITAGTFGRDNCDIHSACNDHIADSRIQLEAGRGGGLLYSIYAGVKIVQGQLAVCRLVVTLDLFIIVQIRIQCNLLGDSIKLLVPYSKGSGGFGDQIAVLIHLLDRELACGWVLDRFGQIQCVLLGDNWLVKPYILGVRSFGKAIYIPEFGAAIDKGKGLIVPGIGLPEELLKVGVAEAIRSGSLGECPGVTIGNVSKGHDAVLIRFGFQSRAARSQLKGRALYRLAVHVRLCEGQVDKLRVVEVQ